MTREWDEFLQHKGCNAPPDNEDVSGDLQPEDLEDEPEWDIGVGTGEGMDEGMDEPEGGPGEEQVIDSESDESEDEDDAIVADEGEELDEDVWAQEGYGSL